LPLITAVGDHRDGMLDAFPLTDQTGASDRALLIDPRPPPLRIAAIQRFAERLEPLDRLRS
jgi:hypothetical protein